MKQHNDVLRNSDFPNGTLFAGFFRHQSTAGNGKLRRRKLELIDF